MRLLAWFIGVASLVLVVWLIWGQGLEAAVTTDYLTRHGHWAWAIGLGLLISDIILPIPGTVVMSGLGYIYGPVVGGLLAAVGSTFAGLVAYGCCRLVGQRVAVKLLGQADFERGQQLFHAGGGWVVAVSRALPILPEAIACTAGLVRMPFYKFLGALLCGSLPMGFIFAAIGASGKSQPAWAIGLSVALPAILWALSRLISRNVPPLRKGKSA